MAKESTIIFYQTEDRSVKIEAFYQDETFRMTQKKIGELFGVQRPPITKHLKDIFESGELNEDSVSSILEHTARDGKNYKTTFYNSAYFDKQKADKIRKIINEKIPFTEYEEEIQGILVGLEFKNIKNPTFTVSASLEDATYHGKICNDLRQRISEHDLKFPEKEYTFKIKTRYLPETPKSTEKYVPTLLEIIDLKKYLCFASLYALHSLFLMKFIYICYNLFQYCDL